MQRAVRNRSLFKGMEMEEIFDQYVEVSFGKLEQDKKKLLQIGHNYGRYFSKYSKEAKVLDIGIGRGEMLTSFGKWGFPNHLGIDISSSTIAFCSKLGLNCLFVDNPAEWLDQRPGEYSVITLLDVLEHIPKNETIDLLKVLRRALTDDGVLIIQVPNMQANHSNLHMYQDFTHYAGFTEHSLNQVLHAAGYQSIEFHGMENQIGLPLLNYPRRLVRFVIWSFTRLSRKIQGTLNPRILHPVFYAVAGK
jgi:2-polyprenyl-3-methyl-5-hydroxy-6-metoxy-1,4-benzoquinol methylase